MNLEELNSTINQLVDRHNGIIAQKRIKRNELARHQLQQAQGTLDALDLIYLILLDHEHHKAEST